MPDREVLFSGTPFTSVIREAPQRLIMSIESLSDSELLNDGDRDGLIERLLDQSRIAVPVLDVAGVSATERPAKAGDDGEVLRAKLSRSEPSPHAAKPIEIIFRAPFKGDPKLFRARPSKSGAVPPAAEIEENALVFRIARADETGGEHRAELDRILAEVERYLSWLRTDCLGLETVLQRTAVDQIAARLDGGRARQ